MYSFEVGAEIYFFVGGYDFARHIRTDPHPRLFSFCTDLLVLSRSFRSLFEQAMLHSSILNATLLMKHYDLSVAVTAASCSICLDDESFIIY